MGDVGSGVWGGVGSERDGVGAGASVGLKRFFWYPNWPIPCCLAGGGGGGRAWGFGLEPEVVRRRFDQHKFRFGSFRFVSFRFGSVRFGSVFFLRVVRMDTQEGCCLLRVGGKRLLPPQQGKCKQHSGSKRTYKNTRLTRCMAMASSRNVDAFANGTLTGGVRFSVGAHSRAARCASP